MFECFNLCIFHGAYFGTRTAGTQKGVSCQDATIAYGLVSLMIQKVLFSKLFFLVLLCYLPLLLLYGRETVNIASKNNKFIKVKCVYISFFIHTFIYRRLRNHSVLCAIFEKNEFYISL